MSRAMARAARCLLALSLCAAGAGCAAAPRDDTVTILVPWSGAEYKAFISVIKPFERQSGVQVFVESSRALTQQLTADLAAPPDLVDLPSPAVADYYFQKKDLKPLTVNLSSYDQPWQGLAELGTGKVYVVPVKVDVKSLIWYKTGQPPPATWAALESLSGHGTPWCLGLASGATSGWPGADWVADILLSTYGATAYQDWLDGEPRPGWTSAHVENAWNTWGDLMRKDAGINGGAKTALQTAFNNAAGRDCLRAVQIPVRRALGHRPARRPPATATCRSPRSPVPRPRSWSPAISWACSPKTRTPRNCSPTSPPPGRRRCGCGSQARSRSPPIRR